MILLFGGRRIFRWGEDLRRLGRNIHSIISKKHQATQRSSWCRCKTDWLLLENSYSKQDYGRFFLQKNNCWSIQSHPKRLVTVRQWLLGGRFTVRPVVRPLTFGFSTLCFNWTSAQTSRKTEVLQTHAVRITYDTQGFPYQTRNFSSPPNS